MTDSLYPKVRAWIDDDPDPRTAAELTSLLTSTEAGDEGAAAEQIGRAHV